MCPVLKEPLVELSMVVHLEWQLILLSVGHLPTPRPCLWSIIMAAILQFVVPSVDKMAAVAMGKGCMQSLIVR